MKFLKSIEIIALYVLAASISLSCSKGKSPLVPTNDSYMNPPPFGAESEDKRSVVGIWLATINPDSRTFAIEPTNRIGEYHFPLSDSYPNVVKIASYGFTSHFWADIRLSHPFPGSGIDGFDPRVIAVLPANSGVSMDYPSLQVLANHSVVLHPDGYTKLFDRTNLAGNVNPFLAYFKDQPNRVWSSTSVTQDTRRWELDLAGFNGPMSFYLVVDVCSNYPSPPQPVTDNAPEPVEMNVETGLLKSFIGSDTYISVKLIDWQGYEGIGGVVVEAPDLFDGTTNLEDLGPSGHPNEYVYYSQIRNDKGAPNGEYNLLVAAWDNATGITYYNEISVVVQGALNFNLTELTPQQLNFSPQDVFVWDKYVFVAGETNGLHIFSIADNPSNPKWINSIGFAYEAFGLWVEDGLAYVANGDGGLQIVDVDPPEGVHPVKKVMLGGCANDVCVSNGYAFLTLSNWGVAIVDVEPVESAHVAKIIPTSAPNGVSVSGDYVYVSDFWDGLLIIEIDLPEIADIVATLSTGDYPQEIWVDGNIAYIANGYSGILLVDITTPESPKIVSSVPASIFTNDVFASGGYAIASNVFYGVGIVDVDPPVDAHLVKTLDVPGYAEGVKFTFDGYAYIADMASGLITARVQPPESASLVNADLTPGQAYGVEVANGYAFVSDMSGGLQIVDLYKPESAFVRKYILTGEYQCRIRVEGEYAYAVNGFSLLIIDIDPIETSHVVKQVNTHGWASDVDIWNNYALIASGLGGMDIIDISNPDTAAHVLNVNTPGWARGVSHMDNYAYVADQYKGLQIIKFFPFDSASIVGSVQTTKDAMSVAQYKGYAYVAEKEIGLQVIDVDPPDEASIVRTINLGTNAYDVTIYGSYAYVACGGMWIYDLSTPANPQMVEAFKTRGTTMEVCVTGQYAYLANNFGGLRIISLW